MARYPAEHKRDTRERILSSAEAIIKDRGVDAATVEAVMRGAGLTVGGFYAHFPSKEALARESLLAAVERSLTTLVEGLGDADPGTFARTIIDRYLSQLDDPRLSHACPLTLLLPEVARSGEGFREAFGARTAALLARVEDRLPAVEGSTRRETALALFASLAGAVAFARAAPHAGARRAIVRSVRAMLQRWLGLDATARGMRPPRVRAR